MRGECVMASYQLKINIEQEDVDLLNSLQRRIVIVKTVDEMAPSAAPDSDSEQITGVAWVTSEPWPQVEVKWENQFAVYASDVRIQSGATIRASCIKNALSGSKIYNFTDRNIFSEAPYQKASENTYYIHNLKSGYRAYTFGLAQSVKVNDDLFNFNPINATSLINNELVSLKPIEKIKVFLQTNAQDAKVISLIQSNALDIDLTDEAEVEIKYNREINKFEKVTK